jgi:SAM-dependent methyltransferase
MVKINYTHCPVCGSVDIGERLRVKDYTVSGEIFAIFECTNCSLRFTEGVPDEKFIAPYYRSENYISHTDTAKGFVNWLYHIVRRRTLRQKRRLIEQATAAHKGKILDIGCGTGAFLHEMKSAGWEVTGLEPEAAARDIARAKYGLEVFEMAHIDQIRSGSLDIITLWHVLEHVQDLQGYMTKLKGLLAPDGKILIAVPNYSSLDGDTYRECWAAYDVPRHLYHFSPRSMEVLAGKNGLTIIAFKPMWYDSFYISILSSRYKNGKTNWLGACWTALRSNLRASQDIKLCSSLIYVLRK